MPSRLKPVADSGPSLSLVFSILLPVLFLSSGPLVHCQYTAPAATANTPAETSAYADRTLPTPQVEFQPADLQPAPAVSAPRAPEADASSPGEGAPAKPPVASELIFEGEGAIGHYHIFAYSWWSELYTGGIEYDRHTWDYFLGSQLDWSTEVLPVAILVQPSKTDVFGDPLSKHKIVNPGVGIYPVGLRAKWRYDKTLQPYFVIKGGMLFFERKALSRAATYQNFSLQIGIGMQRRLTKRIDARIGYEDIHFSNAFMVPSNPGLDVMAFNGGIVYRLGK